MFRDFHGAHGVHECRGVHGGRYRDHSDDHNDDHVVHDDGNDGTGRDVHLIHGSPSGYLSGEDDAFAANNL